MARPFMHLMLMRRRRYGATVSCTEQCVSENAKALLKLVTSKGPPLTPKEVEYCDEACIARLLKAKGNQVNKAAKQLRTTLSWRASYDVEYLTADEFSAELACGIAYVAGHDEQGRPVLVVKLKPESVSNPAQKQFLRYMAFCMEVAIASMPPATEQCVLILDAGRLKKGSPGMSTIVQLLKVVGEHYPERLARTFIVDAPPMFYYLWKGIIGKLLDLKIGEKLRFVFSKDYHCGEEASTTTPTMLEATRHLKSLWAGEEQRSDDEEELKEGKPSSKTRAHTTMGTNSKTLWSSSLSSTSSFSSTSSSLSSSVSGPINGAALPSDKNQARSFSFASALTLRKEDVVESRSFRVDTKSLRRPREEGSSRRWGDITFGFKKDDLVAHHPSNTDPTHKEKSLSLFSPYYKAFFLPPYNEATYRTFMKPPLGGLISIITPKLKFRQSLSHAAGAAACLHIQ